MSDDSSAPEDGDRLAQVHLLAHQLDRQGVLVVRLGLVGGGVLVALAVLLLLQGLLSSQLAGGLLYGGMLAFVGITFGAVLRAVGTYLRLRAVEALRG